MTGKKKSIRRRCLPVPVLRKKGEEGEEVGRGWDDGGKAEGKTYCDGLRTVWEAALDRGREGREGRGEGER